MSSNVVISSITGNQYKKLKNFEIIYGIKDTKFGKCLMGIHGNCICYISLFDHENEIAAINDMQADWPNARLELNNNQIRQIIKAIFDENDVLNPAAAANFRNINNYNVLLKGTELQVKVWKVLTTLQEGTTTNYEAIARAVGNPKAVRAVANAIAKNKIAYLIPCHRVVRKRGSFSKYRWGSERKMLMLQYENAKCNVTH